MAAISASYQQGVRGPAGFNLRVGGSPGAEGVAAIPVICQEKLTNRRPGSHSASCHESQTRLKATHTHTLKMLRNRGKPKIFIWPQEGAWAFRLKRGQDRKRKIRSPFNSVNI